MDTTTGENRNGTISGSSDAGDGLVGLDERQTVAEEGAWNPEADPSSAQLGKNRRFAVKLRLLGSSAGYFLLLVLIGVSGLLLLEIMPPRDRLLFWAVPMGCASVVLLAVWATRHRQYEYPTLVWYLSLIAAALLTGIGWSAFLVHALNLPLSSQQSAALILLTAEIVMGSVVFAVDLVLVGVFLLGVSLLTFLELLGSGARVPGEYQWLLIGSVITVPLLALWGHRQQRFSVWAQAELQMLKALYQAMASELLRLKDTNQEQTQRHREVQQELYLVKDEAESASVAKTEFLATMSHEIRTPLNGIVPILEILRETRLDAEQAEFVATALNSSHHLLNLINDILDYSKIEAGKLDLESIELNVEELVDSVIALMTKSAERRGIHLKKKIARNVPSNVRGDPFRLRQILTNLVGNAIKFTEKGSVSVEVSRHASAPKEVVILFAVRDTGIGMSREAVAQLFQLFSQADASTTRKYGGTGLGLVICKRLVEMMGGRIGVKSEESRGSVFWFVVPMRRGLHEVPSMRRSLQGARVLLAGFDEMELKRIGGYLDGWEMLSEHAATAMEALNKLKGSAKLGSSWGYDVLICDAQTLGVGMAGLVNDIRKVFELSSLVILALDSFPSIASTLRENGLSEVLARPIQEKDLRSRLNRLLDVQTYSDGSGRLEDRSLAMPDQAYSWEDGRPETRLDWKPPEAPIKPQTIVSPPLSDDQPLSGKVLVVEDNPVNLTVVKKLLQRFGLDCDAARDGTEAVEATRNTPYDLVLMDVQMPKMDGYQATGEIRWREHEQRLEQMPIVAMTANAMAGDREKCLEAGMDDYMSKPVRPAELKDMLRKWLPAAESGASRKRATQQTQDRQDQDPMAPDTVPEGGEGDELDREILQELFEIMEDEASALLLQYLDTAPGLMKKIAEAVRESEADALVLPAHTLKSSSANVGAMQVSELARKLEFMGRDKKLEDAADCWRAIESAYARTVNRLERIIEQGGL